MSWSLRHKFLAIFLSIATSFAAIGILAPLLSDPNSRELSWSTAARAKLIDSHGRIKRALFSPDDDIREVLLGLISSETHRIMLASYIITDRSITEELIKAHRRGVKVEIIVCRSGAHDQWTKVNILIEAGIPVYVYPEAFVRSLMHNKFIVFLRAFNRAILATGSYNMTTSANRSNQENLLFIDDSDLIRQYGLRFEHLKHVSVLIRPGSPVPPSAFSKTRKKRSKSVKF